MGGALAALLLPQFGWRSVWYVGGALPLVILPLQFLTLPESIRVLVLRSSPRERIAGLLKRLDPTFVVPANAVFDVAEMRVPGVSVRHLFSDSRGAGTVLLWAIFILNLLEIFLLQSWLPALTHAAGLPIETAVSVSPFWCLR
jgi:MFS transporter, AAHS family, 4-hydroxybenzoate transporter